MEIPGNRYIRSKSLSEKTELALYSAIGFGCLVTLIRIVVAASLPFEFGTGGEGVVLNAAARIVRGLSPYPPITHQLPYVLDVYGPLPYFLGAVCVKLFGISFAAPRILVALPAAWSAAIVGLLIHRWGGTLQVSAAFGLLFLATGTVQEWVAYYRVDLIGIVLTLTGFYIYAKSPHYLASVPLFVAALYCKFTLLSAPIACFLYLLYGREWRKAFSFGALAVMLGGAVFVWLERETHGWFAIHTIWANANNTYSFSSGLKAIYKQQLSPTI